LKKHSVFLSLGLFAGLALGLSGCSLLFVAQGETRYVPSGWAASASDKSLASQLAKNAPSAASLEAQAQTGSKTKGTRYQVQKGDSPWILAKRFYGKGSAYPKLLSDNQITPQHPLKVGTWLTLFMPTLGQTVDKGSGNAAPDAGWLLSSPRPKGNRAFGPGERLKFEVRVLSVLGGYATLEVGGPVTVEGRPCLSLTALASSAFPFSTVYPVQDLQTSYFDAVDFLSWKFQNDVHEGDYKARNLELYDQLKHQMVRRHNLDAPLTVTTPAFAQDIISCFYYFRLMDIKEGGHYVIPTCSGGKNYQLLIDVVGKERVTVPAGTFDCLKARPQVRSGTVFRNKEDIVIWVTDDARHIPVKVESAIVVGTISIDLLDATLPETP
jgi:LysM repeat protein